MKLLANWLVGAAVLSLGAGCGGGTQVDEVETEFCEHLEQGPAKSVAAGGAVDDDHQRYDISLTPQARSVTFAVDHPGEYTFGLDQDVPLTVHAPNQGAEAPAESTVTSGLSCPALKKKQTADLATVGVYTLTFGGTDAQTVRLVIEHGEHSH